MGVKHEGRDGLYRFMFYPTFITSSSGLSPMGWRGSKTVLRVFVVLALAVSGVLLAEDVGHVAGKLTLLITRNPGTIWFTQWLRSNAPPSILALEQDLLVHLSLGPYFLVAGILVGLCLPYSKARLGVVLPAVHAVWFHYLVVRISSEFGLPWSSLLDVLCFGLALTPLYLIGVNVARAIVERRLPKWHLRDLFVAMTALSVLLWAIVQRPSWGVPLVVLITLSLLAWRTTLRPAERFA